MFLVSNVIISIVICQHVVFPPTLHNWEQSVEKHGIRMFRLQNILQMSVSLMNPGTNLASQK